MDFGVNPDDDPELALALRASMEEQQEVLLQRALAMSMDSGEPVASAGAGHRDLSSMTEEEQIAYAMQVSAAHIANNYSRNTLLL